MGLIETKIGPPAVSAVRSFSQRSPQILGILGAQLSKRELCPRAKWRKERCWEPTFSACKLLILLGSHFDLVRIPRAHTRHFSEVLFLFIPSNTRPSSTRQFRRSSFHSPRGWLRHPNRLRRPRWRRGQSCTNIQKGSTRWKPITVLEDIPPKNMTKELE